MDTVDQALGFDRPGPKPITLGGVTAADFAKMETKVAAFEATEPKVDAKTRARLEAGEVVSSWKTLPDGATEELTRGVIDMPIDAFMKKMPPETWGRHLHGLVGGEVKPFGNPTNRQQVERMVLRAPGPDLDMTKLESVKRNAQGGSTVRWQVLKSDNGTVVSDVGLVKFERFGNKTLVTFHSAHEFPAPPLVPAPIREGVTGLAVSGTFKQHIEAYRTLAATR